MELVEAAGGQLPWLCLQSAHMAMVDALMMAYTVEMISIEKVVASVKRFSTFSASKELPYDLEDAMVFWVNKVSTSGCPVVTLPERHPPRRQAGTQASVLRRPCCSENTTGRTGVPSTGAGRERAAAGAQSDTRACVRSR